LCPTHPYDAHPGLPLGPGFPGPHPTGTPRRRQRQRVRQPGERPGAAAGGAQHEGPGGTEAAHGAAQGAVVAGDVGDAGAG